MKTLAAALIAATLVIPEEAVGYTTLGSASASCETWTTARRTPGGPAASMHEQWVLGFLSGIGFMMLGELDPLLSMDANEVANWVDTYCRGHPQDKLEAAAAGFIREHPR